MAKERETRRKIAAERGGLYELLMIEGRYYFVRVAKYDALILKRKPGLTCAPYTGPISEIRLMYQASLVIDVDKGKIVKNRFGKGPVLMEKQIRRAVARAR